MSVGERAAAVGAAFWKRANAATRHLHLTLTSAYTPDIPIYDVAVIALMVKVLGSNPGQTYEISFKSVLCMV